MLVGYADDSHAETGKFPTPWYGSTSVAVFLGVHSNLDGGAVRIDYTGSSDITLNVTVSLPNATSSATPAHNPVHPPSCGTPSQCPFRPVDFNLWGSFTLPANKTAILAQTVPGDTSTSNFDTSDYPTSPCGVNDTNIANAPIVNVAVTTNLVVSRFVDAGRAGHRRL